MTADIARERGLSVDMAGFDAAMEHQRETARAAGKFASGSGLPADLVAKLTPTSVSYTHLDVYKRQHKECRSLKSLKFM